MPAIKLKLPTYQAKFGFLYLGFRPEVPFWGVAVLARKIAILFVTVFMQEYPFLQSFGATFVVVVALCAQYKVRPFDDGRISTQVD